MLQAVAAPTAGSGQKIRMRSYHINVTYVLISVCLTYLEETRRLVDIAFHFDAPAVLTVISGLPPTTVSSRIFGCGLIDNMVRVDTCPEAFLSGDQ